MADGYGVRYLNLDDFVRYCSKLKIKTDKEELQYYEQIGVMLPIARVIYPEDYVKSNALLSMGQTNPPLNTNLWPDLFKLFGKSLIFPKDYAALKDDELIDSFDREMGHNQFLVKPTPGVYKDWDSYTVTIPTSGGHQIKQSAAVHYYGYWQAHQLHYLQHYPDLYENRVLLDKIDDEVKKRLFRPWRPSDETLREFNGLFHAYDALSFFITIFNRERQRTFATVPENDGLRQLDPRQHHAYLAKVISEAKMTQTTFGLNIDNLYDFLYRLIELYGTYQDAELFKLSEELKTDILYQAQFIEECTGSKFEAIADELGKGKGYAFWTKQTLRQLNTLTKERDEAFDVLNHFANMYHDDLVKLGIPNPTHQFLASDINELLDYCQKKGFVILAKALGGMVATEEEYKDKFRDITKYTNIMNILTCLEFLLKDFADNGGIVINGNPTLNPVIRSVLKIETKWIPLFERETAKGITSAVNSADFLTNLNLILQDPDLVKSEDTYWARAFLVVSLARNLTVHVYPDREWFYGKLFGTMLQSAIYALLYSWQVAKREGWT